MKKIIGLVLGAMLLISCPVFAEIAGEIGIVATEDDSDIFVKAEATQKIETLEFKIGAEVEKSRNEKITTKDKIKVWSEYKEYFSYLFLSGDIYFENDNLNLCQKTIVAGSIGKDFKIEEITIILKTGIGRIWSDFLEDATIFKAENKIEWKSLYEKTKFISAVDNVDEFEVEGEIGAITDITKTLALKTSYRLNYQKAYNDKYEHCFRSSLSFSF